MSVRDGRASTGHAATADIGSLRLTCETVERWLHHAAPGTETPAAIADHLRTCRACSREHLMALRLRDVRDLDRAEFGGEGAEARLFVRSVLAGIQREPTPVEKERRTGRRRRAGGAALVLACVISLLVWIGDGGGERTAEPARGREAGAALQQATTSGRPRLHFFADPGRGLGSCQWIPAYREAAPGTSSSSELRF